MYLERNQQKIMQKKKLASIKDTKTTLRAETRKMRSFGDELALKVERILENKTVKKKQVLHDFFDL